MGGGGQGDAVKEEERRRSLVLTRGREVAPACHSLTHAETDTAPIVEVHKNAPQFWRLPPEMKKLKWQRGKGGCKGLQARTGGKLIHILFCLFILAYESKSCRPPPSARLTANNGCHTVNVTGGE